MGNYTNNYHDVGTGEIDNNNNYTTHTTYTVLLHEVGR